MLMTSMTKGLNTSQQEMLTALAAEYTAPLKRYFIRHSPVRDDVDDLVQEVFIRIARMDDFSTVRNPQAYLFQTASSLLKDRARHAAARQSLQHQPFDDLSHGQEDISPERLLIGKEDMACLKEVLLALPPKTRAVFILHRFEGLKYREISETLNMSFSSVEKHMMLALSRLQRGLRS